MSASATRNRLSKRLTEFAWAQWAQMGVMAAPGPASPWAQDPEALLLLTFELGREEPRLFDEVLDWLVVNEASISTRRLRNLCRGPQDERLAGAVLDWLTRRRRPNGSGEAEPPPEADREPLFRAARLPTRTPDRSFAAYGLIRPEVRRSENSNTPDVTARINLAFRLRHLLGLGARAEAVRSLLTIDAPRVTVAAVASSAGYAKRNVQEALGALHAAGAISLVTVGADHRFGIDRTRWSQFLGGEVGDLPVHRDWPQLLTAMRVMLRWLARPELASMSPYLRASQAGALLDEVRPMLEYAGVPVPARRGGENGWQNLVDTIEHAALALEPRPEAPPGGFEVYATDRNRYRWRLKAPDGRIVATSGESYASEDDAGRGAEAARAILRRRPEA